MYRTGNAAGSTGPTALLPPGQRRKTGYDNELLVRHGAMVGSTIVMTPTEFMMTEEAWDKMTPCMANGIRAMPVIRVQRDGRLVGDQNCRRVWSPHE